jgi:hypothetical protein
MKQITKTAKGRKVSTFGFQLLILLMLPATTASAQDYLNVITTNDPPVQSFQLENIDVFTFDTENMYIRQTDNSTTEFPFGDIVKITFLNPVITLTELFAPNIADIDIFYSIMLNSVTVKSSSAIKHIAVYNMLGRMVKEIKPNALQAEILLRDMPQGLYIISAVTAESKTSKKIIKQ